MTAAASHLLQDTGTSWGLIINDRPRHQLLSMLAKAMLTIPHGNTDIE